MDFFAPNGRRFDIPDEWWIEAGMQDWNRNGRNHYLPTKGTDYELIDIRKIELPYRSEGTPLLGRERLVSVLRGFRLIGQRLPPVWVSGPWPDCSVPYKLRDGFHRFYASVAVGFSMVPAEPISWQTHQDLIDQGIP